MLLNIYSGIFWIYSIFWLGFDDIGRHFDEDGNKNFWWTNTTIQMFLNRTECFKKQYSEYYLPEIGDYVSIFEHKT